MTPTTGTPASSGDPIERVKLAKELRCGLKYATKNELERLVAAMAELEVQVPLRKVAER